MFIKPIIIRWSDLDPNFHLRHSVYYDYAASMRIALMGEIGITPAIFQQHQFGPILFREECIFRRELKYGDEVQIDLHLLRCTTDYERWTFVHRFLKGDTVAAILTADGAWMHTVQRKLTPPPAVVTEGFNLIPKAEGFTWVEKNSDNGK
jgi:acyl-CoA thioester hydrolase